MGRSWVVLGVFLGACETPDPTDSETATPPVPSFCETETFGREVAWDGDGPYGTLRWDLAEDFTLPLRDGTDWTLSDHWTGCESYLFLPDWIPAYADRSGSVWDRDLADLVDRSPDNVHYFFVSMEADKPAADAALDALSATVDQVIDDLGKKKAEWWGGHLHVVKQRASALDSWVGAALQGSIGENGLAVDRMQRVRAIGSWADPARYNPSVGWYDNNLRYAAKEVEGFNAESRRQARMEEAQAGLDVPLFSGEVISQYAEVDATLPSAEEMGDFDTFEIDVEMRCPNPASNELYQLVDGAYVDNCGAWDYLAYLWVQEEDGSWTELGRFITTYHREARWVLDATPMLALLLDGGPRRFKWEWAPPWNVQPTETHLALRFSNQGKGISPATATKVATGGGFNGLYNEGRLPVDVAIPADAAKVELVSIVTGHGAATNQCAEFCDHQHQFTVGGSAYRVEFPEAGTLSGCEDAGIDEQMTPNQWGTWWFGRGGWCPGQPVVPRVFDITGDVTPGQTAAVGYEGQYNGGTPPDNSGDIVLNAWVVTYR